jgi:hypothetical protein
MPFDQLLQLHRFPSLIFEKVHNDNSIWYENFATERTDALQTKGFTALWASLFRIM